MNQTLVMWLAIVLFIVFLIDNLLSEKIVGNISKINDELCADIMNKYKDVKDNTEMIKEMISAKISEGKNYLNARLIKAFPNFKIPDFINKNK